MPVDRPRTTSVGRPPRGRAAGRRWSWRLGATVAALVGAAAAVTGTTVWHRALAEGNRGVVADEGAQAASAVSKTLERYADLVAWSTQALGSGAVDAGEFHSIAEGFGLGDRYPGIEGLGFVGYFPDAPGGTMWDSTYRCTPTVAEWVGPPAQPIAGMDFCSVPWLRQAMLLSATTAQDAVISERTLGKGYASDFVLIMPYYRIPTGDPGTRLASLGGWGAALVNGTKLLAADVPDASRHVGVQLFGALRTSSDALTAQIVSHRAPVVGTAVANLGSNPPWTLRTLVLSDTPGLDNPWLAPALFLVGGLWFVGTAIGLVLLLVRSRERALVRARASEQGLHEETVRFASLAGASPVGILETTGDLRITYVNARLAAIAGRPADELLGTGWLDGVHPDDRQGFLAGARAAAGRRGELDTTLRIVRPSGGVRTLRVRAAGLHFDQADAGDDRYVATVEDVTDELALQAELQHRALHDGLTGLPNRALFMDRLQESLGLAARSSSGRPAVLFFDVDRFKVVNDGLGHDAGDALLRALAERLGHLLRAGETLARLGGDEFAVLLPRVEGLGSAEAVARRILESLEVPFRVGGHELGTTVSIGIVVPRLDEDPAAVLRDADVAMYRAKEQGRARYAVFHDGLYHRSLVRLQLEGELRRAIDEGQLVVHYQPVVGLPGEDLVGAEALVRWQHPERGLLLPGEFIDVAEETGLVVPIGQWVFAEAMAQLRSWDTMDDVPRLETMAVNLSARQLRDRELSTARREILDGLGLAHARLCIEVTERVAMDDDAVTRRLFEDMRRNGVSVAIDDFGTGYSSLAYLQTLPVKVLKIDKRFVEAIELDGEPEAIVTAVITMGHHLGLQIVAEGVETARQRDILVRLGCDAAQGFLWGTAMPSEEFVRWCRRRPSSSVPRAMAG